MTDIERDIRIRFAHYTSFSEDEINTAIKTVADALAIDLDDDLVVTTENEIVERIEEEAREAEYETQREIAYAIEEIAYAIKDEALSRGWIKDEKLDAFIEYCDRMAQIGE